MSIQKTPEQKEANLANISIVKARFAKDGQFYKDAIFNNDTLEIRIEETFKNNNIMNKGLKKIDEHDVDRLNSRVASMFEENNKENILSDLKSQFIEAENKTVINEDKLISKTLPINDGFIQKDNNLVNDGLIIKNVNTPVDDGLIIKDINTPVDDGLIIKEHEIDISPVLEVINNPEVDISSVSKATDALYLVEDTPLPLPILPVTTPNIVENTPLPPQDIDSIEQMFSNPDFNHTDLMNFLKNKRNV